MELLDDNKNWLITIGLVTSSIITVIANLFLLLLFCRRRGLRTVPNRFVINLLITNLLSSFLLTPLLIIDQDNSNKPSILSQNATTATTNGTTTRIENVIIHQKSMIISTTANITDDNSLEIISSEDFLTESMSLLSPLMISNTTTITNQKVLCYFAQSSTNFVCTLSIFSILLIGINQYFGVLHSLRYHVYINKCRSMMLILATWLVALLCGLLSVLTRNDNNSWTFCQHRPRQDHSTMSYTIRLINTVYAFGYFIVIILAPFVAICVIYVCIYTAAHKNSERMRKSTSANLVDSYYCAAATTDDLTLAIDHHQQQKQQHQIKLGECALPKVRSAPNFRHLEQNDNSKSSTITTKVVRTHSDRNNGGGGNNFITSLKHRLSNSSVFRYREETRAAKISILVIFLVLICYLPYGVTLLLNSALIGCPHSAHFNYLSLVLLVISNIISPFLFAYRNRRVKREIGRVFGLIPASNRRLSIGGCGVGAAAKRRQSSGGNILSVRGFNEPFLVHHHHHHNDDDDVGGGGDNNNATAPKVIITCNNNNTNSGGGGERKSILKRVCNTSNWTSYKKCNFITVPDSCLGGDARGSFSSASTQISNED